MEQYSPAIRDEPQTIAEARRAVEASRERLADTLDVIEQRLVAKKAEISERVDVLRPVKARVRARPLPALVVAFGLGLLLGLRK